MYLHDKKKIDTYEEPMYTGARNRGGTNEDQ